MHPAISWVQGAYITSRYNEPFTHPHNRRTSQHHPQPKILHGDNIIIYYSRHGSCYPSEEKGDNTKIEYIEALCPIDHDIIDNDG
ncbi:hypothetical protein EDD85DRAFT_780869 [Armillaria nabsnona]|nr:hypothetical protein EDD85DRAFT_780869 [Armillaria nabsnona]